MTKLKYTHLIFNKCDIDNITMCGVYKMYHISDEESFYIGSTASKGNKKHQNGFYNRWRSHLMNLKVGKHYCKKLQSLVNEFGLNGVRFQIIEIVEVAENCKFREQFYLDSLKPKLNNSKSATSCLGVKHSIECRLTRSERTKGKILSPNAYLAIIKKVYKYDRLGNKLSEYPSIAEASKENGIDRASINNCALGKRPTAGGFFWHYDKVNYIPEKIIQCNLNGEKINEFARMSDVVNHMGINSSTAIKNCFTGKQKQAYGFKWIKQQCTLTTEILNQLK